MVKVRIEFEVQPGEVVQFAGSRIKVSTEKDEQTGKYFLLGSVLPQNRKGMLIQSLTTVIDSGE